MPKVLNAAKRDHGLDKYAPSRRYKTRLQRRIQRLGKDESELDWKEDGGEYAERICLAMVEGTKEALPHALSCLASHCSYSAVKLLCGESLLKTERYS